MEKLALRNIFARMVAHKGETPVSEARPAAILIADDSRTVVRALQLMLEREGYLTHSAFDGEQAVALTRRHQPDLVLMDIVMPNMNGFEATRVLVNDPQTAAIPIIMVSGSEQPADRIWGLRLGAKGFLAKPISKDDLLAKVRITVANSRHEREREHAASTVAQPLRR